VTFLETIPFLIFGFFSGVIGDRFDRRKIMLISDLARVILLAIIPLAYVMESLSWQVLGLVAFGVGVFSALFNPAKDAMIPDLVDNRQLIKVNSFFQTSTQIAIIAGTGLSAALLGVTHEITQAREIPRLVFIFGFDSLTFLVSACFIYSIRKKHPVAELSKTGFDWFHQFQGMLRWIRTDSLISGLLLVTAIDNLFIMGPAIVGTNLFVKNTLGMGAEALAFAEFILAVGMTVSAFLLLKLGTSIPKGRLVLSGILLDGLTFIPFYWIRSYPLLLLAVFVHSLTIPLIIVPRTTLVQENVHRKRMAKAFALINLTIFGFWSISSLLAGSLVSFMAGFVGPVAAPPCLFLIAGIGGAFCGMAGCLFRGLRTAE